MSRIIHFELAVDEPDRAIKFYSEVLGWKTMKWEGPVNYWLITTGPDEEPGINGAFTLRADASAPTINTADVTNLDETLAKVTAAGGTIVAPKMVVPGVGWMAYCKDTEGNVFGLMQGDPEAK